MKKEYEMISGSQKFPLNVLMVRLLKRAPHLHKEIEIGLVLRGNIDLILLDSVSTLQVGDMYVLNPMDIHSFSATEEDVIILAIQFPRKLLSPLHTNDDTEFSRRIMSSETLNASTEDGILKGLLVELAYQYFYQAPNFEYKCLSLLNMVYYMVCTILPTKILVSDKDYRINSRLIRIIDYIEQHYNQKTLLSDIAENEGLSLTYLSHFFKDNLKISFQDYLNTKRLKYAQNLLVNTDKSIIDISIESGFSDPRYLNTACKKYYNCTAIELREKKSPMITEITEVSDNQQHFSSRDEAISLLNNIRNECAEKYKDYSVWKLYRG